MAMIPSDERASRDVALNIVPFIDLMSCLTAFLLVTAVWSTTAALDTRPAGRGRAGQISVEERERVSVQLDVDRIWIGNDRTGERRVIDRGLGAGAGSEWTALEDVLRATIAAADALPALELAAQSTDAAPVLYADVVAAMDSAVRAGFPTIGLTDPASLTTRPQL